MLISNSRRQQGLGGKYLRNIFCWVLWITASLGKGNRKELEAGICLQKEEEEESDFWGSKQET